MPKADYLVLAMNNMVPFKSVTPLTVVCKQRRILIQVEGKKTRYSLIYPYHALGKCIRTNVDLCCVSFFADPTGMQGQEGIATYLLTLKEKSF